jgi:hypothetical protein
VHVQRLHCVDEGTTIIRNVGVRSPSTQSVWDLNLHFQVTAFKEQNICMSENSTFNLIKASSKKVVFHTGHRALNVAVIKLNRVPRS